MATNKLSFTKKQKETEQLKYEIINKNKINIATNDLSLMHEAIPFLPFSAALICLILNIFIPGTGCFFFYI